ncbi:DUF3352 domain-containing protein [Gillisia hiemivivida]|uniref:Uncharacterized protein n=1 Tax=Gillisia hiemivivida TaxID=291190 RepID=A0A5C6ZSX1_9FLAO|nr:DUF3352 domain-containing protein [Gillisia hiemivivida]TXD92982.1 hypothetical protein ES724_12095 [Gillisia hiemivivida]
MTRLLTALLVVFTLISCEKAENYSSDLFNFVPENSYYIISSNNVPAFIAKIDSSTFFDKDKLQSGFNVIALKEYTDLLIPSKSLIAFSRKDSVTYNYLVIAEAKKDTLVLKKHPNFSIESISTEELDYKKITIDNNITYSVFIDNTILASSSKTLLIDAINHSQSNDIRTESFQKAIAGASLDKTSIFINHSAAKFKAQKNSGPNKLLGTPISDWSVVDLDLSSKKINFNGIAVSNTDSENILEIFQNVKHQKNELQNIVPISANRFYSFTYKDFKNVDSNLKKFKKDSLILNNNNLLNFTKEAGVIYLKEGVAIALNTTDAQLAKETLPSSDAMATDYRGVSIYSISENTYLKFLEPLIPSEGVTKYAFIENFLVYSKNQETLELIISNYQNNTTYAKHESFLTLQADLAESSSLLIVSTPNLTKDKNYKSLPIQITNSLSEYFDKDYNFLAIQYVKSDGFSHIHGSVTNAGSEKSEDIQETVTISLPESISGEPFLFSITNKTNAIVYQDINNVLYAVSNQGTTLWKKQLESKILGELQQIDINKNGSKHLAFATLNNFFVIDAKGKETRGFPLKFNDLITQPLAIFDYDNKGNYRFVITQKNKLLMYNAKGNSVNGFDFKGATSEIIQPPKHIRIKNKDYIVVPEENGKLHILSRQGKERITVKGKIDFSESAWYENSNSFVSLAEDGKLLKIDSNGKISKVQVKASNGLKITANENVLVLLSTNILKINNREIQLDFGLYTEPSIYKFEGKSYISIADTQAKKVYLFNENGELLPNFPTYGVGISGVTSAKQGVSRTALILGEGNEVILYNF